MNELEDQNSIVILLKISKQVSCLSCYELFGITSNNSINHWTISGIKYSYEPFMSIKNL